MFNGLYSGASAMNTLSQHQEIISSNLMHVNTPGHRRNIPAIRQRFDADAGRRGVALGPEVESVQRDFSAGRSVATGRALDVAITGDGFFIYNSADQEILSRNGRLYRNPNTNELVNEDGLAIQGQGGPINIPPDIATRNITIGDDGTVSADGQDFGQLRVVAAPDNQQLQPVGTLGFMAPNIGMVQVDTKLEQFHHELSNVKPVNELISLIVNTRQYEAMQRAARSIGDTLAEFIRS